MDDWLFREVPTAILTFSLKAQSQPELQEELFRRITILRLFRVGSVRHVRYTFPVESFTRADIVSGGIMLAHVAHASPYKFAFGEKDIKTFDQFFDTVHSLLPTQVVSGKNIEPIGVAIQRFSDAVLLSGLSIENRIALAVSCLEALYLKGPERSELTHRLSQRAAAVVGCLGLNSIEVYRKLLIAYDIRSTFIHGSAAANKSASDLKDLSLKVLEYARLALVVFLQVTRQGDKDKFIGLVDNSLLDDSAREKLRGRVAAMIVPN